MTLARRELLRIPRRRMPQREASTRARSFGEVNLGLSEAAARVEAIRCLQCRRPPCVEGCPVGVRIDEFIDFVAGGLYDEAATVISVDNCLPGVCGRVCPQETQCEAACVLARRGESVAIGYLERFVADRARPIDASRAPDTGHRVAVVGSGPAGLSCAGDLARLGHRVTVFEALHEPGGVLVYGIPEYRLPKAIVRDEIERLEALGVEIRTNAVVGRLDTVDDLLGEEGFAAVFLGVGAGLPRFLDVPGEDLIGVYSANEFLTRVNLMGAHRPDAETPVLDAEERTVAVFGGGNTAMDGVRTALRLGARRALLVYRRSEAEMPARREEIEHAIEEGVEFVTLAAPLEFYGDEEGLLTTVRLQRMRLGPPGEDGRRRPEPVPGEEWLESVDIAVVAVGNLPNPLLRHTTPDLVFTRRGTLAVDEVSGATSRRGVYAGGDIVSGGTTVIEAMGAGRRAARAIHQYLVPSPLTPSAPTL